MSTLLNVLLFLSAFILIVLVLIQPDRSPWNGTASYGG
ncbi:PROTEIN TRANSLOCASE SUBUNIT SECG [Fusobacterium vincentii ATCC 49256]|uniref:PROTEIN TRANSLOCASE SUBUNIT SECG n=1 Tax=Fusobacterium vincentii ATCC 49256 TaxID=209882 RepID=Q7P2C7_FUSVC|nr:PROTEIN TRANSLOCASE SUBUNIT SECG [Fusobacterium vincentii ATCC 49256]